MYVRPLRSIWNANRFSVFWSVESATFKGKGTRHLDSQTARRSGPLEEQRPSLIQSADIATLGRYMDKTIVFTTNLPLSSNGRPTSHPHSNNSLPPTTYAATRRTLSCVNDCYGPLERHPAIRILDCRAAHLGRNNRQTPDSQPAHHSIG